MGNRSRLQKSYDELSSAYDLLASKNSRNMAEKAKETKSPFEAIGTSAKQSACQRR